MKILKTLLFYLASVMLVAPFFTAIAGSAHDFESLFTNPENRATRYVIQNKIVSYLRRANSGSEVLAVFEDVKSSRMKRELLAAYNRGVRVKLILSHADRTISNVGALREALGSNLIVCGIRTTHKGCMGSNKNDNNFILYSSLNNGFKKVVIQTSQSLNTETNYDNALVIRTDGELYDAYKAYWNKLKRKQYARTSHKVDSTSKLNSLYSGTMHSSDMYISSLRNILCVKDGNRFSSMYIAMDDFDRSGIASMLAQKAREGCFIKLILNEHDGFNRRSTMLQSILSAGVRVWLVPKVNSKYFILNGFFGRNGSRRKIVWSGTRNFTSASQKTNDSAFVRVVDRDLYYNYLANWKEILKSPRVRVMSQDVGSELELVTWNILGKGAENSSKNAPWSSRKAGVIQRLLDSNADVLSLQEVSATLVGGRFEYVTQLNSQLNDLKAGLESKYNYCEGPRLWWLNLENSIFVKKGIEHDCLGGYYHLGHSNSYNCNSARVKGQKIFNCHFNYEPNGNLRTTQEFLDQNRGSRYIATGDFNFGRYHPKSKNRRSAYYFRQELDIYPYREHGERYLVDKIGVSKGSGLCLTGKFLDFETYDRNLSNHRLVTATVINCE